MTDREKLVEVLKQAPFEGKVLDEWWWEEKIAKIADHLIANGVAIVDNHVGKTAYGIWDVSEYRTRGRKIKNRNSRIDSLNKLEWVRKYGKAEVRPRVCTKSDMRCLGKTLFWTREEAERVIQNG